MQAWSRAGLGADPAPWLNVATLPQRWQPPAFPLKAEDFVGREIAEGPALGHVLAIAEDAWLAEDFPLNPRDFRRLPIRPSRGSRAIIGYESGHMSARAG